MSGKKEANSPRAPPPPSPPPPPQPQPQPPPRSPPALPPRRQWHGDDGYNGCCLVTADGASWAPAVDDAGRSTLLLAAERGQTDVALELLARGAAADAADDAGWTPLMWAAVHGNGALASALLAAGARPRAASRTGVTALILASFKGHRALAAQLLAAEGDADRASGSGARAGGSPLPRAPFDGSVDVGQEIARRMGLPALIRAVTSAR